MQEQILQLRRIIDVYKHAVQNEAIVKSFYTVCAEHGYIITAAKAEFATRFAKPIADFELRAEDLKKQVNDAALNPAGITEGLCCLFEKVDKETSAVLKEAEDCASETS